MYKNRKPLIIGILCTVIVFMTVGFALFSSNLTITGTSSIDSNWNIRITNIRVKNVVSAYGRGSNASGDTSSNSGCTPNNVSGCTGTTANFNVKLITPGDSITYEVTITNSGNLDGVVSGITLSPTTTGSDAIQVSKSGLAEGDTISHTSPNNTNTIDVTVTYNSATTSQPASTSTNITLTVNYQQNLSVQQNQQEEAQVYYAIDDIITLDDDSEWVVIKDSPAEDDYVTIMKWNYLTDEELGEYVEEGHVTTTYSNAMSFLQNSYIDVIGEDNLKEVDGYKVRLLSLEDLFDLDFSCDTGKFGDYYQCTLSYSTPFSSDEFAYIFLDPLDEPYSVWGFHMMNRVAESDETLIQHWFVSADGNIQAYDYDTDAVVRPVINILKTAIPSQS